MRKSVFWLLSGLMIRLCTGTSLAQTADIPFRAYELRMGGDPHAALALLDSALQVHPDSSRIWFEKGRCMDWIKAEDCDKFIDAYRRMAPRLRAAKHCLNHSVRLDPDNARYHYWAAENGILRTLLGFYSPWKWPALPFMMGKSVRHAETAVLLQPDDPEYRFTLIEYARFGRLLGGNKKLALAHTDTLELMDPVYGTMARKTLETRKVPFDAAARYHELESKYPENKVLMLQLALTSLQQGNSGWNQAIHYYRKVLEIDPLNTEAISGIQRTMVHTRNEEVLPDILKFIENAASAYPFYQAIGQRTLGRYYDMKGDKEKARECYALSDRLYPDNHSFTSTSDIGPPGN